MDQDAVDLYERLRIALDRADRGVVKIADELSYVLTEGYAYALELELRERRIEKRIVELAGADEVDSLELGKLAGERPGIQRERRMLHQTLERLDRHCESLPTARELPSAKPEPARAASRALNGPLRSSL
jgi:hypothetical protein